MVRGGVMLAQVPGSGHGGCSLDRDGAGASFLRGLGRAAVLSEDPGLSFLREVILCSWQVVSAS